MRPSDVQIGDLVADKYRVDRLLGRGGMSLVYAVSHRVTGKPLALKCLLPTQLENPSSVARFLQEAKLAGRIQHRHVIDVFDAGRDGDLLYLVMPLLQGKPLSELLDGEQVPLGAKLLILRRAMEGVAAAHAVGIVHRDLKPANIFVCTGVSGQLDDPRVLDFGISKPDDEAGAPLTRSGAAVGTPSYMALEQLTGARDLDQRVDVYAMGVILYEAISGRLPHVAESVGALALKLAGEPPRHLYSLRPDLPPGLCQVVMSALARDREQRPRTMAALMAALAPFVDAHGAVSAPAQESGRGPGAGALGAVVGVSVATSPEGPCASFAASAHDGDLAERALPASSIPPRRLRGALLIALGAAVIAATALTLSLRVREARVPVRGALLEPSVAPVAAREPEAEAVVAPPIAPPPAPRESDAALPEPRASQPPRAARPPAARADGLGRVGKHGTSKVLHDARAAPRDPRAADAAVPGAASGVRAGPLALDEF